MRTKFLLAVLGLMAASSLTLVQSQPVSAQKGAQGNRLVEVAKREIDVRRGSSETIDVRGAKGSYRALRVVSSKGPIYLTNVQVRYSDGSVHEEKRNIDLKQGERTREIDNRGQDRFIDQVTLTYNVNAKATGSTSVQLLGLQTAAGATAARPTGTGGPAPAPIKSAPSGTQSPTTLGPGPTGREGEIYFGRQTVGFARERDTIKVNGQYGRFRDIRLRVFDNDITINELVVSYTSGASDKLAINADIRRGEQTQWIAVKPNEFIRDIQISYRAPNAARRGEAVVDVYGRFSDGWIAEARKDPKNQGWVLIGAQVVNRFVRNDDDVVPISRSEGGFKRIRVDVKDRAIVLNGMTVVYTNGSRDSYPIKGQRVNAGDRYGPIEINKPGNLTVDQIVFRYRNVILARGGAGVVEIWAHD